MKKLFLLVGAAALVACANERDHSQGAMMYEPSGAAITTNSMDSMPARDVNQQPYPGASSLNQQRGSGSVSDSSVQGSSSGNSTGSGNLRRSGSSSSTSGPTGIPGTATPSSP